MCVQCVRALRACIACVHCVYALRVCIACVRWTLVGTTVLALRSSVGPCTFTPRLSLCVVACGSSDAPHWSAHAQHTRATSCHTRHLPLAIHTTSATRFTIHNSRFTIQITHGAGDTPRAGSHRSAACTPRHIRTHLPQYGEGGGPTWRKSSGNDCTDARSNAEACSLSPQPAYTDGATTNCNCPPTALQLAAGMACAQIPYSQDHSPRSYGSTQESQRGAR